MAQTTNDPRASPTAEWIEAMRARFPVEPWVDRALTRKLMIRAAPRYVPLTAATARAQLERFLSGVIEAPFTVDELRPLAGGASKEQFAFRLRWQDAGRARDERLVLRMQPAQSVVETHRLREFQILRAVRDMIPVPEPLWVDAEGEVFQQPALIYAFCDGVSRPPEGDGARSVRGTFSRAWRETLAPQFIGLMGRMATLDLSGQDLSAFEIPRAGTTEGVIAGIDLWHRAWEEDRLEAMPLVTLAAQWLRRNAPPIDHVSLVHGDYRAGNFLFDPHSGRITAVLDWENARFGDRHEDLATLMLPALGATDEDGTFLVNGFCPRAEFIARYEAASGLPVDPDRLDYYELYTCFRSVCMSIGSAARCLAAQKTHQDIVQVFTMMVAGPTLDNLREALARRIARGT